MSECEPVSELVSETVVWFSIFSTPLSTMAVCECVSVMCACDCARACVCMCVRDWVFIV